MRRTMYALLAAACLALAGCSDSDTGKADDKPAPNAKGASTGGQAPQKLEPVWAPKLEAAAGADSEAVSACQMPSSNACARYVGDIMAVVRGLEAAIDKSGRAYPASTEQIGTMTAAESDYEANGCQGDPTADDPNSQCHGVVNVTLGSATLSMTLLTDEAGM